MRLDRGQGADGPQRPRSRCATPPIPATSDSKALIARWHGRDRLLYAVTPRFAPTSTERQLELCGRLLDEHPGVFLQSHVAENRGEVRVGGRALSVEPQLPRRLRPLRPRCAQRAVYAHCIHLDATDRQRMAATGAAMSFCATSNLFLGSGLFDLGAAHDARRARGPRHRRRRRHEPFDAAHAGRVRTRSASSRGQTLSPLRAFYLATLGGAAALCLDDRIGNFALGKEADFVVLDPAATPLLARRMARADDARREAVRAHDPGRRPRGRRDLRAGRARWVRDAR